MYMYLQSLNVVVVFLQPIFTETNLTESKFIFIDRFYSTDKKGEKLYRICCFIGLKYLLSTLIYNSSHLFLANNNNNNNNNIK